MGLFSKIFGSSKPNDVTIKGFNLIKVKEIERLTNEAVKVVFDIPDNLKSQYQFVPGQYVNVAVNIDGKEERRSYSICSGTHEPLAIGVKAVRLGKVSNWFFNEVKPGEEILISTPTGGFQLPNQDGRFVAFAAGSGITPILSMMKSVNLGQGSFQLFYGNRERSSVMFFDELKQLESAKINVQHALSQKQDLENAILGKLDKQNVADFIKANLDILKADGFFICGPEQMIVDIKDTLRTFGVSEGKIHFELFTVPTLLIKEDVLTEKGFQGIATVTVILDDEEMSFDLSTEGDAILDEAEGYGIDVPYSCRGGVCSTCKAKILSGTARMRNNLSLTDSEIKEGYILTCQAHPTSEKLVVSYDE